MTQDDWTRWGNRHPVVSTLMMLGIYALCWIAWLAAFALLAALFAFLGSL